MSFKKILVAYEGSEYANKAFEAALDFAKSTKAEIVVASVIAPPEPSIALNSEMVVEKMISFYKDSYARLKGKADAENITTHLEILSGPTAEVLVNYAESHKVDLIVIGARTSVSFLNKLLLGTVSHQVVDNAPCSVLVTRI
jgi:nucleotide-binding universal stress UspA family protein